MAALSSRAFPRRGLSPWARRVLLSRHSRARLAILREVREFRRRLPAPLQPLLRRATATPRSGRPGSPGVGDGAGRQDRREQRPGRPFQRRRVHDERARALAEPGGSDRQGLVDARQRGRAAARVDPHEHLLHPSLAETVGDGQARPRSRPESSRDVPSGVRRPARAGADHVAPVAELHAHPADGRAGVDRLDHDRGVPTDHGGLRQPHGQHLRAPGPCPGPRPCQGPRLCRGRCRAHTAIASPCR